MPRTKKMLQTTASGTENLVCRSPKRLKHHLVSQEENKDNEAKKMFVSKETQVNLEVTVEDLTSPDGASSRYWAIVAARRLAALHKARDENDKLKKVIEDLKQELLHKDKLLEEANSFVEVIKEELANGSNNDTGIDVNDVSTLEDTDNTSNGAAEDSDLDINSELDASKDH